MTELRLVNTASANAPSTVDMVARVSAILSSVELDCACRSKLDHVLRRFADLEQQRRGRQLIADARAQAIRITSLLEYLRELDEIATSEPDVSVFAEIACLFDDISEAANTGAKSIRQINDKNNHVDL